MLDFFLSSIMVTLLISPLISTRNPIILKPYRTLKGALNPHHPTFKQAGDLLMIRDLELFGNTKVEAALQFQLLACKKASGFIRGVPKIRGTLFWGPYNKDATI